LTLDVTPSCQLYVESFLCVSNLLVAFRGSSYCSGGVLSLGPLFVDPEVGLGLLLGSFFLGHPENAPDLFPGRPGFVCSWFLTGWDPILVPLGASWPFPPLIVLRRDRDKTSALFFAPSSREPGLCAGTRHTFLGSAPRLNPGFRDERRRFCFKIVMCLGARHAFLGSAPRLNPCFRDEQCLFRP
jgi:hypothetical protein